MKGERKGERKVSKYVSKKVRKNKNGETDRQSVSQSDNRHTVVRNNTCKRDQQDISL